MLATDAFITAPTAGSQAYAVSYRCRQLIIRDL